MATTAGSQIETAAGGLIRLTAGAIGSAAKAVTIDPTTGDVGNRRRHRRCLSDAGWLVATSQIVKLDVAQSGSQIVLASAAGTITVDATSQFNANTADDHLRWRRPREAWPLRGERSRGERNDRCQHNDHAQRRRSPRHRHIGTRRRSDAIGRRRHRYGRKPLRIDAGTGIATAATQTGNVYLRSPSGLNLGLVQTGIGQQTVSVSTGGDLNVVASSTTDDDWQLIAGGDLNLVGSVTLQAGVFSNLQASGNVNGGSAAVDFRQTSLASTLVIHASAVGSVANPIVVDLDPTSLLDLTASAGDLCLLVASGDLTDARFLNNTVSRAGQRPNDLSGDAQRLSAARQHALFEHELHGRQSAAGSPRHAGQHRPWRGDARGPQRRR